ncbi:hypothetical protein [Chromobacterium sphagni]|uniref:hypothetical protein n=1 Tax=Chromobacterium sphagni TaxID=1903179 RepID=UPI0026AFB338
MVVFEFIDSLIVFFEVIVSLNSLPWIFSFFQWPILMLIGVTIVNLKNNLSKGDFRVDFCIVFPRNVFSACIFIFSLVSLILFFAILMAVLSVTNTSFDSSELGLDSFVFLLTLAMDFYGIHYLAIFRLAMVNGRGAWLATATSRDVLSLVGGGDVKYQTRFIVLTKLIAKILFGLAMVSLVIFSFLFGRWGCHWALLHKSWAGRASPFPKQIYATATVHGGPAC